MDYDLILDRRHCLTGVTQSLSLEESLDEIAIRASAVVAVTPGFPAIAPGMSLVIATPALTVFDGLIWECASVDRGRKSLTVTAYDHTIYLAKSEDECLLPAGRTATQRVRKYAADWGVTTGRLADTGITLSAAVRHAQSIYSMIRLDLTETVRKGGSMFRARMSGHSLDLIRLGDNRPPWSLATGRNVSEVSQSRTLEGARTRVKVLGRATESAGSEILAIATGETDRYGTLQAIVQDSSITSVGEARGAAAAALTGVRETISVSCPALLGLRAGDTVELNGVNYLATRVNHTLGGDPGLTRLDLADAEYVRRTFYA